MVIVDKVCFMIHLRDKFGKNILALAVRLLNHRSQKSTFRLKIWLNCRYLFQCKHWHSMFWIYILFPQQVGDVLEKDVSELKAIEVKYDACPLIFLFFFQLHECSFCWVKVQVYNNTNYYMARWSRGNSKRFDWFL